MSLFDPVRGKFVAPTPEEQVRQRLIHAMIGSLGYPKGLLGVEKGLQSLGGETARRVDLLCYYRKGEELKPLLLIECKAGALLPEAENQLLGYNWHLAAPFFGLANEEGVQTFWREQGRLSSVPFLPPYQQLLKHVC